MRLNRKLILFFLATLIVLFSTGYVWTVHVFIKKDIDYRYRPASPNELYYSAETVTISGFQFPEHNKILIQLDPPPPVDSTWSVTIDGQSTLPTSGPYPIIPLKKTLHDYHIRQAHSENGNTSSFYEFSLKIDYFPRELYAQHNSAFSDSYRVVSSTLPINKDRKYPIDSFVNKAFPPEDIRVAQKIISEEIGLDNSDSTKQKIEKIGLFLYSKLYDSQGIPSKELSRSPLQQYSLASSKKAIIWCSQMSIIFGFFANVAGIPTRLVNLGGAVDTVSLSAHTFVESYIKELQQWVFVDMTQGILFISDSSGKLFNALDLFMLRPGTDGENMMSATVVNQLELAKVPYKEIADKIDYYFNRNATIIYQRKFSDQWGPLRKPALVLKAIFNPDFSFSLRNTGNKHLVAVCLFITLLVFMFIWLFLCVNWIARYRRFPTIKSIVVKKEIKEEP